MNYLLIANSVGSIMSVVTVENTKPKLPPKNPAIIIEKTFNSILEKKGYKLIGTIGNGSYAKVK